MLPIPKSTHYAKYEKSLTEARNRRPCLSDEELECYGWHGTKGEWAKLIAKTGFDMSKITSKCTHAWIVRNYFPDSFNITTSQSKAKYATDIGCMQNCTPH